MHDELARTPTSFSPEPFRHSRVTPAASLSPVSTQASNSLRCFGRGCRGRDCKRTLQTIQGNRSLRCLQNSDSLGITLYIYKKEWGGRWKLQDVCSTVTMELTDCCENFGDTGGFLYNQVNMVRVFRMLQFGHKNIFQNELLLTPPFGKHTWYNR